MKALLLLWFIQHELFPSIYSEFVSQKISQVLIFIVLCLNLCRAGNGWWWVPITAPFIGGLLGAGIYKIMVEMHHPVSSKRGEGLAKEESIPLGKQENPGADVGV